MPAPQIKFASKRQINAALSAVFNQIGSGLSVPSAEEALILNISGRTGSLLTFDTPRSAIEFNALNTVTVSANGQYIGIDFDRWYWVFLEIQVVGDASEPLVAQIRCDGLSGGGAPLISSGANWYGTVQLLTFVPASWAPGSGPAGVGAVGGQVTKPGGASATLIETVSGSITILPVT